MLRLLRADVAVRARRSSDHGLAEMAGTLHSTVTWADEIVRVQMRRHEEVVDCGGTGLVPSVMMNARGCAVLTDLAVSTASHHLAVLRDADLIDSRRSGVRVLHTRTPLGEALAGVG